MYRRLVLTPAVMLSLFAGGCILGSCIKNKGPQYEESDLESMHPTERDPLPGDLVKTTLEDDSLKTARVNIVKQNMVKVIQNYRKRFKEDHFNGYFLTDFNDDGLPELWVKIGNYRENAQLELYYPLADGSLRKSHTLSEPGQYYLGDHYLIQVVGSGPGFININRIQIHNGTMDVETIKELDLYKDPTLTIPKFSEREVRHTSLTNLTPLYNAFK